MIQSVPDAIADFYHAEGGFIARFDHCNRIHRLDLDHGCLGHQQRALVHRHLEPDATEPTGAEHGVSIGKFGDQLYGPCLARNLPVHQDDPALPRISRAVRLDELQDGTGYPLSTDQPIKRLCFC